jgi:putative flippase GtrA
MNGLMRQAAKFAAVGGGTTLVHVLAALSFNSLAHVAPLRANFFAFLAASCVSYLGNWFWTFDASSRHAFSLPRFAALSLSCFVLNQAIVYGVVERLGQPLWIAMVPVIAVVPAFGFWLSKTQVFPPKPSGLR